MYIAFLVQLSSTFCSVLLPPPAEGPGTRFRGPPISALPATPAEEPKLNGDAKEHENGKGKAKGPKDPLPKEPAKSRKTGIGGPIASNPKSMFAP